MGGPFQCTHSYGHLPDIPDVICSDLGEVMGFLNLNLFVFFGNLQADEGQIATDTPDVCASL
jgi:hypothetical protein